MQLVHVTVVVPHDAFQRVNAGVEWRHPVAHVLDNRMRSGNLDVLFSAAGRARRADILVAVASGADDGSIAAASGALNGESAGRSASGNLSAALKRRPMNRGGGR